MGATFWATLLTNPFRSSLPLTSFIIKANVELTEMRVTGYINDYDGVMDYHVPQGWVIRGAESDHDNHREDRVWRLKIAKLN